MKHPPTLTNAIVLSATYHAGQTDKSGLPYILHPLRVMLSMDTDTDRIAAVLHDIVEDTDVTLDGLRKIGYSDEIIEAIDALSHRNNESRKEYLIRVKANPIALRVKQADIIDNSDEKRLINLPPETQNRLRDNYLSAMLFLTWPKETNV